MRRISICMVVSCGLSIALFGQDTARATSSAGAKAAFTAFLDSTHRIALNPDTLASQARQLSDAQFQTALALEIQKQRDLEDAAFSMQHRWRSFSFQYTASIIIFILVIVIVIAGLVFSGWQFHFTLRQLKFREALLQTAKAADGPPSVDSALQGLKSELEVSSSGVKLNSSILGVIILTLSIAFFYLYILYVYPIKFVTDVAQHSGKDSVQIEKR